MFSGPCPNLSYKYIASALERLQDSLLTAHMLQIEELYRIIRAPGISEYALLRLFSVLYKFFSTYE
jgi:hypothetical protein